MASSVHKKGSKYLLSHGAELVARRIDAEKTAEIKPVVENVLKNFFYREYPFTNIAVTEEIADRLKIEDPKMRDKIQHITGQFLREQMRNELAKKKMLLWKGKAMRADAFIKKEFESTLDNVVKQQEDVGEDVIATYRAFMKNGIKLNEEQARKIFVTLKKGALRSEIDELLTNEGIEGWKNDKKFRLQVSRALNVLSEGYGKIQRGKFQVPSGPYGTRAHTYVYGETPEIIDIKSNAVNAQAQSDYKILPVPGSHRTKSGWRPTIKRRRRKVSEFERAQERVEAEHYPLPNYSREETASRFLREFSQGKTDVNKLKNELENDPRFGQNTSRLAEEIYEIEEIVKKFVRDPQILKKMGFKEKN